MTVFGIMVDVMILRNLLRACYSIGLFFLGILVGHGLLKTSIERKASKNTYVYSSKGPVPTSIEYGLPVEDLEFLAYFEGPLLNVPYGETMMNEAEILPEIHERLQYEYEQKQTIIRERFPQLTDYQLLLVFLMLRINGSFPVYEPTFIFNPTANVLIGNSGNCTHYTLRLLMVLDAFQIPARAIPIFTPSLPGHMVVEAFDAVTGLAALIDVTNNLACFIHRSDSPFFEKIASWSANERLNHVKLENQNFVMAPFYIRYFNPGYWLESGDIVHSHNELNHHVNLIRLEAWQRSLTKELDQLVNRWDWDGWHHPFTLNEYGDLLGRKFGAQHATSKFTSACFPKQGI